MKKKFLLWLMQTSFYSWLLLRIVPFIRVSTYYTSMRGWKYRRGYRLLQTGDILLAVDRKKLTTMLIGGEFTHAALCVSCGSEWEVSEMEHLGYVKSTFFDICKEADRVVILRCTDFDDAYIAKLVDKCKSFDGYGYDVEFNMNSGIPVLYCSGMVYESDFEHRLQVSLEDLAGIGRPYISPTGIFHAKNGKVIWDSDTEVQTAPGTYGLFKV